MLLRMFGILIPSRSSSKHTSEIHPASLRRSVSPEGGEASEKPVARPKPRPVVKKLAFEHVQAEGDVISLHDTDSEPESTGRSKKELVGSMIDDEAVESGDDANDGRSACASNLSEEDEEDRAFIDECVLVPFSNFISFYMLFAQSLTLFHFFFPLP
jgi:hypothetical protein